MAWQASGEFPETEGYVPRSVTETQCSACICNQTKTLVLTMLSTIHMG